MTSHCVRKRFLPNSDKNLFQIMAGELPGAQVEVWYPRGVVDGAIGYRENICGRVAGHSWTVGCHRRPFWGCQKKNKFTPGCIAELRDCGASSLRLFVLVYFNFTIVFELKVGLSLTSYSRKLVYNWWSLKWSGCNFKKYFQDFQSTSSRLCFGSFRICSTCSICRKAGGQEDRGSGQGVGRVKRVK